MHVFSGYGIFSTNVGVTGKRLSIIGNYLHDMELASATSFDHSLRVQGETVISWVSTYLSLK